MIPGGSSNFTERDHAGGCISLGGVFGREWGGTQSADEF